MGTSLADAFVFRVVERAYDDSEAIAIVVQSESCVYCHRSVLTDTSGSSQEDSITAECLSCRMSQPVADRSCLDLIVETPPGQVTFNTVAQKFREAWLYSGTARRPPVKKVFKIIGTKSFFQGYNLYKKRVGNETFSYHGTTKTCNLGEPGHTQLCASALCKLCSILRTSFKTSFSSSYTAFGSAIYTSTASNKAYNYTDHGKGAMFVSSIALGKVYNVKAFAEVKACPVGYDSVVFDRGIKGSLNETVVYDDDAIRPVYLILF